MSRELYRVEPTGCTSYDGKLISYINCAGRYYMIESSYNNLITCVYPAKMKHNEFSAIDTEPIETFRFVSWIEQNRFHEELCENAEKWIRKTPIQYFISKYLKR